MKNWQSILRTYRDLKIQDVVNFEKYNEYAITHHSTALEGSTLTLTDTEVLLEEGITPKGKPLVHSLMVKDHYEALHFVLGEAEKKQPITETYIQQINAHVMKSTGSIYNTPLGTVNAANGEYRKGNVSAGDTYFINYDKVKPYMKKFINSLNEKLNQVKNEKEMMELSFSAHFDLVSIHPFYDGNGRTSRLLMNNIQHRLGLPVSNVFLEDKATYIQALKDSRKQSNLKPLLEFMFSQYSKQLQNEITSYTAAINHQLKPKKKGGLSLFF